ncbi:MAG: tripartite tricarboxylate transporter TctB family protein [Candidatus Rokubacteria bacterium]|nr:tripartite tricarboxylate transporter TctB family protein [Candidatus Rokubacteria bacterium]
MRARDAGAAGFLSAFAVAALVGARHLAVGTMRVPGPGFFPLVLASALLLVALALLVQALRAPRPARDAAAPVSAPAARLRPALTLVALVGYVFLMEPAGFTLATAALLAVLFTIVAPSRWPLALGGSVVAAGAVYVVFRLWLRVQLPAGPWGF